VQTLLCLRLWFYAVTCGSGGGMCGRGVLCLVVCWDYGEVVWIGKYACGR